MSLLQIHDMFVHYGTAEAVRGVSLDVPQGAVTSILGANGAGKSTILKVVVGLIRASSGEIRFMEKPISHLQTHEIVRLGIALVPEGRRPFPYMSVRANLKLGAYLQQDGKRIDRRLLEIYERFPFLKKRERQKAGTLSGGEQQMLVIGRALMAQPRLLLMDEPTLGLAPLIVQELVGVVRDINRTGISVLLVEQNATLVAQVSAQGVVLDLGKVVLEGNMQELLASDLVGRVILGG